MTRGDVLAAINATLEPHGVRCWDMSDVLSNNYQKNFDRLLRNLKAHPKRAAVIFPVCKTTKLVVLLAGGPDVDFVFLHADNRYCPPNTLPMAKQIASCVQLITGYDETCPICLNPFVIGEPTEQLTCGHALHWGCMARLKEASSTFKCPMCRQQYVVSTMAL